METSDRAFIDFRKRPGRDTLVELLRSRQLSIYIVCLRILRNPHDAEDAAQDVLVEVTQGASRLREPRAFQRWVLTVALHTALDHRRLRLRRARHEEARAAMTPDPPDPAADAVHDALARLADDDRCLLIERYFEGSTLELMASRERLSVSGAGKRIDRAKERLKKQLAVAGLTAFVPQVDSKLEGARPAAFIPDLVSTSHELETALTLAGGAAMGAKVTITTTTAIVALLFLTIGAGGGYMVGTHRAPQESQLPESSKRTEAALPIPLPPATAAAAPSETSMTPPPSPAAANPLLARLDRFKEWRKTEAEKLKYRTPQDYERTFFKLKDELEGVRELIFADPDAFLEWIGRKDNGPCLMDLFNATLSIKQSAWSVQMQEFSALPAPLADGFLTLLNSGQEGPRRAILSLAPYLKNAPSEFRAAYVAMLSEPFDPGIGPMAVNALLHANEPTSSELDAVIRYSGQLREVEGRNEVFRSLGRVPQAEAREWLLSTLETRHFADDRLAYCALEWWCSPGNSPGREFEERAARILGAAMLRTKEQDPYFMSMYTALNLSTDLSLRLLEQAAAGAPNEALRKAAEAVLQRARKSGASQRVLQEAWMSEFRQK